MRRERAHHQRAGPELRCRPQGEDSGPGQRVLGGQALHRGHPNKAVQVHRGFIGVRLLHRRRHLEHRMHGWFNL